jgi:hypothetical protein
MKMLSILVLITFSFAMPQMTARDYYNELKTAGEFGHYGDEYACFNDDESGNFVVMARVVDIIQEMEKTGDTDGVKTMLPAKDLVLVRSYKKGVQGEILNYEPEGDSDTRYSIEFGQPFHGKMRYSFNWTTGRYILEVFYLKNSSTVPAVTGTGKCELIHANQALAASQ